MIHLQEGRFALAIGDLSRAIARGEATGLVYYNRALAFVLVGEPEKAQSDYQTSCRHGFQPACVLSRLVLAAPAS